MPDDTLTPVTTSSDPLVRFLDRAEGIKRKHGYALVNETGRAAFEEIYDRDWDKVHDRSGAQDEPLQALMDRHAGRMEFIGLTPAAIRTALQVHEVDLHLPPYLQGQLSPGKLRRLSAGFAGFLLGPRVSAAGLAGRVGLRHQGCDQQALPRRSVQGTRPRGKMGVASCLRSNSGLRGRFRRTR